MRLRITFVLGFLLILPATLLQAGQEPAEHKADNTRVNKRDRAKHEPTADQQKENVPDRQVAKNIRRALVKDKSLSTYAHNIKVIVQNGDVTLKGPVHSEEEKKAVEAKAAEVAGHKVNSEISVTGSSDADRSKK